MKTLPCSPTTAYRCWRNIAIATAALLITDGRAEEISQFRGALGNGTFVAADAPYEWGSDLNMAWSTAVPGGGWSSPVVADDLVFLTTAVSEETGKPKGFGAGVAAMRGFSRAKRPQSPVSFEVHCLRMSDGRQVWKKVVEKRVPPYKIHPSNTYATESPVTDGKHVYAYFAAIGIVTCLDLEGEQVWRRDVGAYPTSNNFGTGSSLIMADERLFLQCDNQDQSFLMALEATSGDELWRKERDGRTCWSTPILWPNRQQTELVVCGSGNVTSYDPQSGAILWEVEGIGGSFSASPATDADRVYFGNSGPGSRGPLISVTAGASGKLSLASSDAAEGGVAWVQKTSGPGMASPIVCDGRLYVVSRGILSCHDASTGKLVYKKRLPGASSVAASLWVVQDNLFVLDESGSTFVIQVGDTFQLVAKNSLPGLYWSTPTMAGDALLIRGAEKTYCIRNAAAATAAVGG